MSDTPQQPGLDSLPKSFEPVAIEARWGPLWEERGYARAGARGTGEPDEGAPAFSIQLPPPNVTGTLHMGHAFNQTIMDSLTRYHRMRAQPLGPARTTRASPRRSCRAPAALEVHAGTTVRRTSSRSCGVEERSGNPSPLNAAHGLRGTVHILSHGRGLPSVTQTSCRL